MSYKHFTVDKVINLLGYEVEDKPFLASLGFTPELPSDQLVGALALLRGGMVLKSEISRAESLIAPVLCEAAVKSHTRVFSGETFDVDVKSGLVGVVDFLFARKASAGVIGRPVLCIAEAERGDIDPRADGQCMATMIAAQRYNQDDGPVYGSVTTGTEWQFLRLADKRVEVEPTFYYEKELPAILGILLAFLRPAGPTSP